MAGATIAAMLKIPQYSNVFRDASRAGVDAQRAKDAIAAYWPRRLRAKLPEINASRLEDRWHMAQDESGLYMVLTFSVWTPAASAGPAIASALSDDTIMFRVVEDDMPFGRDAPIISDAREYARRTLVGDIVDIIRTGGRELTEGRKDQAPGEGQPPSEEKDREVAGLDPSDERVPGNAEAASTIVNEAMHDKGVIVDTFRADDPDIAKGRTVIGMPHSGSGQSNMAPAEERTDAEDQEESRAPDVVSAQSTPNAGDRRESTREAQAEENAAASESDRDAMENIARRHPADEGDDSERAARRRAANETIDTKPKDQEPPRSRRS